MVGRIRFALERFASPRHRSHVAQLWSLGHFAHDETKRLFWIWICFRIRNFVASVSERSYQFVFVVSQRQHQAAHHIWSQIGWRVVGCFSVRRADCIFDEVMICFMTDQWPNKSPEPTAVARCFCFSGAASRRWLSFFR